MTDPIYHITSRISWSAAQKSGLYSADSVTLEGFIHCSNISQILRVANKFFANQRGLVILVIEPTQLKPEVRWEATTDDADEFYPHIYGPLNLEAVRIVLDFEPGPDGMFSLPAELK